MLPFSELFIFSTINSIEDIREKPQSQIITKTGLFKYIENFTTEKLKDFR